MSKFSISMQRGGLLDRITGFFAPKANKGGVSADKLTIVELLMHAILVLAAIRVIDAALIVNANMPVVARWALAIFTLALTEGGFLAWRAFRYHPHANKAQRDTAGVGMLISFVASLIVGVSDYLGLALGDVGLTINGVVTSGQMVMAWAFGISYIIAIIGHVTCALIAREVDDDVAAKNVENEIEQTNRISRQASNATEMRAGAAADALVRRAHVVSGTLARLAVAPTAASIAAVSNARRQILEQYGSHITTEQVDALLSEILGDLPQFTQQAYTEALREFLTDDEDLGLNPDQVKDAIVRATSNLETSLRGALGRETASPAPRPAPVSLNVPAFVGEDEVASTGAPYRGNGNGNGHKPTYGNGGGANF